MRRAGLIAGLLGSLILGPDVNADTGVDYEGLRVPVPAGWRVLRLGPGSAECLRFDRHAVYLGAPGTNRLCPAHAVDRTEAVHVEPIGEQAASVVSGVLGGAAPSFGDRATRTSTAGLPSLTVRDPIAHEVRVAVPTAGVLITGSYGENPRDLDRVLAGVTSAPGRTPALDAAARRSRAGRPRHWVRGDGFDTCAAPSLTTMRAWRDDFVAANIYIGGVARSCPDGRLSHDWVASVRSMGWRLIPTYVGPQAPCSVRRIRFSPESAVEDAVRSADDAVSRARALGLPRRTPIYFDLEAYRRRDLFCRQAVLDFVDAWTRRMRSHHYVPGVYSSVASGIRDLGRATGISKPSVVWFAHWDERADPQGDRYVLKDWWPGHRRIKQYRGDHVERHGGHALRIDSDAVDGYVH